MNVQLVYASMTGNNEEIADILTDSFQKLGADVTETEISQADVAEFETADICVLVTYTYGEGDMPDEAQDFYDDLMETDLTGKHYGVCGSGDRFYEGHFCATVDDFDQALAHTGAIKAAKTVKIDLAPEGDDIKALEEFAAALYQSGLSQ